MQRTALALCLALSFVLTACGHHLTNVPNATSELVITTADAVPQPISNPNSRGAVTLNVGDHRSFKIMRNVTKAGETTSTDVTGNADFNFSDPSVAAMDAGGQLTALASGFTTLEVVYRDGDGDPTDDDKVGLDITVNP
jgi:hypothetical protein